MNDVSASLSSLRVLVFSSLYPSAARPRHGIFVEARVRQMVAHAKIDARVVAPVPWFPSAWRGFGSYATLSATPAREHRHGIQVVYPRYVMIPKVGVPIQPLAMAIAGLSAMRALQRDGFECDVIDAHYFYPDGVAAALLSRWIGKPFVVTARGSDLNVLAEGRHLRARIVEAAGKAARVLCVSSALRDRAVDIGVAPDHVEVSRNGVDTSLFDIRDQVECRRYLGLQSIKGRLLLCVGNLVPEKDHRLAISALAELPDAHLLIVGDGPLRQALEQQAVTEGVRKRVTFKPAMPQQDLVAVYNAADVLVHPSLREGWPNVLLESMACGRAVVATKVGAASEIVSGRVAGRIADHTGSSIAGAIRDLLIDLPRPEEIRRHAMAFDWKSVAARCAAVLADASGQQQRGASAEARCAI